MVRTVKVFVAVRTAALVTSLLDNVTAHPGSKVDSVKMDVYQVGLFHIYICNSQDSWYLGSQ